MTTGPTEHCEPLNLTTPGGALSLQFINQLHDGYKMDAPDLACHNAVTNNEVKSLALNRSVLRGDDGNFSHRIKTKGVTHQQKSGRCWMFAALNVMRPRVIREHGMAEFEFSTAFLQFWDKMEKSNLYLESIIELRDVDYLDREWEIVNRESLADGGWWNYAVDLIEKYGVVPRSVMPETHSTSNTETINEILGRLLRARATKILEQHKNGAELEELRLAKKDVLTEVYRLLALNFGEPPAEFEWRYRHTRKQEKNPDYAMKEVEEADLTESATFTPKSFYRKFVGVALSEYVCLYNDPKNDFEKHYSFDRARNIAGNACMSFVNIESESMQRIAADSIVANDPLWFAVDMNFDQSTEHGLMANRLFDYERLFGIDLAISKADRVRFHAGISGHAMTLMGVDLDTDGKPVKWLVENSWGTEKGNDGWWTLHGDWFDEHVYTIIVHRRHVPGETLSVFEEEAKKLPAWYPGATMMR